MKPNRQIRVAATLLLFSLFQPLSAQDARVRVVELDRISGDGVQDKELEALERVIASYVVEMDGYKVVDANGAEIAAVDPSTPHPAPPQVESPDKGAVAEFSLSARINRSGKLFVFTIERRDATTGEKKSVSQRFASVNDIVLKARSLTRRLFGQDDSVQPAATDPSSGLADIPKSKAPLSFTALAGFWKGDKGLDRVRISRDGKGSAILNSGVSMKIKLSVQDGRVIVEQDQPSLAAFFSSPSFSSDTAQEIADKARPMRWIFSVSENGDSLTGIKESVAVQRGSDGILKIDNGYTRDAVWTRVK